MIAKTRRLFRPRKATGKDGAPVETVLRNSGWLYATHLFGGVLALVQGVIIARALGVQSFGVLALVTTYVLMVIQLVDSRIWEAIITFIPRFRTKGENGKAAAIIQVCFLFEIVTGLVAFGVLLLTAEWASRTFIKDEATVQFIRVFAVLALVNIPQEASNAILRVAGRFDWIAYQSVVVAVVKTIGVAAVCLSVPSVGSLLMVHLAVAAIGMIVLIRMAVFATRQMDLPISHSGQMRHLKGHFREVCQFVFFSNIIGTSRIVTSKADTLIVGLFTSPAGAGIYELAKRLVGQFAILSGPLYQAVFPTVSALVAKQDFGRLRHLQKKISILGAIVALPVCAGSTLIAPVVIPLIFGQQFEDTVLIFQILIWQLVHLPTVWVPGYLLALGRIRQQSSICVLDALVYIMLLFALTPLLGVRGVAIATVVRMVIWMLMAVVVLKFANRSIDHSTILAGSVCSAAARVDDERNPKTSIEKASLTGLRLSIW